MDVCLSNDYNQQQLLWYSFAPSSLFCRLVYFLVADAKDKLLALTEEAILGARPTQVTWKKMSLMRDVQNVMTHCVSQTLKFRWV